MMKFRTKRAIILIAILCSFVSQSFAKEIEVESQFRLTYGLNWKITKGLKFGLEPELRFADNFSIDSYNFGANLRYKSFGFLYWGASYNLILVPENSYDQTTNNKFGFSVMGKKEFGRYTPSLKVLYSNYADEEITDKKFMRYRAKVEYNIRNCPLFPSLAVEAYHDITDSSLHKMRYSTGVDYKVAKGKYLYLDYKFDYYIKKYKNRNIFGIGYKVNL